MLNERLPSHSFLGKGSVTIIDISSSPGGNVVPDKCRIVVDRRIIPGETEDVVLNEMHNVLDIVKEQISGFEVTVKIIDEPVKFFTKKNLELYLKILFGQGAYKDCHEIQIYI